MFPGLCGLVANKAAVEGKLEMVAGAGCSGGQLMLLVAGARARNNARRGKYQQGSAQSGGRDDDYRATGMINY